MPESKSARVKLEGGPQDGATFALICLKHGMLPHGLWFETHDDQGRTVQNQYRASGSPVETPSGRFLTYAYDGQVVDTGIEFQTTEWSDHA